MHQRRRRQRHESIIFPRGSARSNDIVSMTQRWHGRREGKRKRNEEAHRNIENNRGGSALCTLAWRTALACVRKPRGAARQEEWRCIGVKVKKNLSKANEQRNGAKKCGERK